jgi:hypothetical protein
MPQPYSNIPDELAALGTAITAATATALSGLSGRTPTVYTHDWDDFALLASMPVILIRPADFQTVLLTIGQPGERGQDASRFGWYLCELHDLIDSRAAKGSLIAGSERDLEALWTAIDHYWDTQANRVLSGQALYTGIATRVKFARPFQIAPDSATHVVAVGMIGLVGLPHAGTLT